MLKLVKLSKWKTFYFSEGKNYFKAKEEETYNNAKNKATYIFLA